MRSRLYFSLSVFIVLLLTTIMPKQSYAASYGVGEYGEGVFGQGAATSNLSQAGAPSCGNQYPTGAVTIYSASAKSSSTILLQFTDAADPVDHYVLEYDDNADLLKWASPNIGAKGVGSYLVQSLSPNTTYYFRIRAANGCAIGLPSNTISTKTMPLAAFNQIEITSDQEPIPTSLPILQPKKIESLENINYSLNVLVTDQNLVPIVGAQVTIHSDVVQNTTNSYGIARFDNIKAGSHKVLISYKGFEGEQSIFLSGETKEINLNITIELKNFLLAPQVIAVVVGLLFVIVILLILLIRSRLKHI